MHRYRNLGMTLIELMVVVGIIMMLGGVMAYFIVGSRQENAQASFVNDVVGLINSQRSRAMGLNVATYIRFDATSVQPAIGETAACSTSRDAQYPIRYRKGGTTEVAIDYTGVNHRTLDSEDSRKYFKGDDDIIRLAFVWKPQIGRTAAGAPMQPVICFQPNGHVQFMDGEALQSDMAQLGIQVRQRAAGVSQTTITVSTLGLIQTAREAVALAAP